MTVQFEITKKDVLLQVKTEAFVTGEANKDGELSRINHATKTQASDDDDDILNEYINTAASAISDLLSGHLSPSQPVDQKEKFIFTCQILIRTIQIRTGLSQTASKIICRPILYTNGIKGWLQTWQMQVNWKLSGLISIIG